MPVSICATAVRGPLCRAVFLLFIASFTSACGGGGGVTDPPKPDQTVATVDVTAPAQNLQANQTMQLAGTARNASGATVGGKTFTWQSSSEAIASVSSTGLVTGRSSGSVTMTATETSSGRSGFVSLSITPIPVASLTIEPASVSLQVGASQALTVTARDAAGIALSGRSITLVSSDPGVASVDGNGLVTARAGGSATITATSEGKSASAAVNVTVPEASRVVVSPAFATMDVGARTTLGVSASAADGSTIVNPSVSWSSQAVAVASVSSAGEVSGIAAGQARVVARVNSATDTTIVAVLGAGSVLSTAWVNGSVKADVRPGQTITVPVVLDLSKVSSTGDLGAAQFELRYDPAVLVYQSATSSLSGGGEFNVPTAGTFKFSSATTDPQGTARPTLATITFQVAPGAAAGVQRALSVVYTAQPTSTSFQKYELPIAVAGRIRVVN